jgi:hypothetical protein
MLVGNAPLTMMLTPPRDETGTKPEPAEADAARRRPRSKVARRSRFRFHRDV